MTSFLTFGFAEGASMVADFSDGMPDGWMAKGARFGSGDKVEMFQSDLLRLNAKPVSVDGIIVSPQFTLTKPWLNIKLGGEKLVGNLDLVLVVDGGDERRVLRNSPFAAAQNALWLKDGWFSFEVSEYVGETVYFQLSGVNRVSDVNIARIEAADTARGNLSLDWYVAAVTEILDRDRPVADSDPFRPVLHTRAPSGKSWDANGLVFKDGLYHFFYLTRPNAAPPFQGHKVSRDLVHWEERPPAVVPSVESGETAVWSGSAVIDDDGRCHIFYTGVGPDRGCLLTPRQGHAVSVDPDFNRFEKVDISMITVEDVPFHVGNLRDPFAFRDAGKWYMTITGSILREGHAKPADPCRDWPKDILQGAVLLFESEDLYDWKYINIVLRSEDQWLWEVSDLFHVGDRWFFSPGGKEYHVGTFDLEKGHFNPTREKGRATCGTFYAYRSMTAPDGRIIVVSRLPEGGDLASKKWEGVYSFAREWSLEDEVLYQRPVKELQVLRNDHAEFTGPVPEGVRPVMTADTEYELIAEFDMGTAKACGLEIRRSADGSQAYRITWDGEQARAEVVSEEAGDTKEEWWKTPIGLVPERKSDPKRIKFHLFVDRGLVELFVDDQKTFERPVEDIPLDCNGIAVFAEGGNAKVLRLDRWNLKGGHPSDGTEGM